MSYYKVVLGNKKDDRIKREIHVKFSIAPGDIPFGVQFKESERSQDSYHLKFDYNSTEERTEIDPYNTKVGAVLVVYGTLTGRIYDLFFPKEISKKALLKEMEIVKNWYISNKNEEAIKPRVFNNIKFGTDIVKQSLALHKVIS